MIQKNTYFLLKTFGQYSFLCIFETSNKIIVNIMIVVLAFIVSYLIFEYVNNFLIKKS